jgi:chromosome segregation ATPase
MRERLKCEGFWPRKKRSSIKPNTATTTDDLSIIYQGGARFLDRMRALDDARCASEEAYQRLQIGTDAKAAYEDAKREREEAKALRREAEKVLDDAKAKATKIVAEAETIRADAVRTNADADELRQRHERQLHDAQDAERKALASAQASRQAIAKAEAKEREFQGKINRLREAISASSAGLD